MIGFKYFIYSLGILLSLIASIESCEKETRKSGLMTGSADSYYSRNELCRDIPVPPNHYVRLKIKKLQLHFEDCENNKLEILIKESAETYSFCKDDKFSNSITSLTDVRVYFVSIERRYVPQSFELSFEIKDIECLSNNSFHCSDHSCIPKNEVCDGIKDCENGADEVGCETGILSIKGVGNARSKEIRWIKSKRTKSWGWLENTPRVLFSLHLSGGATFNGTNSDEELMAKQMEIKTSIALLKSALSAEQLSMFINSLLVTCHNPRHFYGQNLIRRLKEQVQSTTNFTHPIAYLTLCNAKEPWPLTATADLNKLLSSDADSPFVRDYQAIAVMAVSCYENQTKFLNKVELSSLKTSYENVIKLLKESQLPDGSFGNLHTTSLISQALISSGQEYEKDWKLNATIHYLLQQLDTPHDIVSGTLTLPVLNAKSLSDISKVNCTLNPKRNGYDNNPSEMKDYTGPKMRVQYSLFIGDQKDVVHTISLRVPENYTAYEVMKFAETEDPKYGFKYKKISGVMYVFQIGEMINDPEGGYFWLLYQGQENINETLNHYNLSPDQLVMQNKEQLVMWYKKATL